MSGVRLLPFPPPVRAALAISNDLDDLLEPRGWWEFLRFLNTAQATRFGPGLGLEIGDSFWFYSDDPEGQPASYFRGLGGEPSEFAPWIGALGRAGYLDTLHSYGNFSRHGGFTRGHAERAAAALRDEGFAPKVWVNHGGAHDFQNLWSGCGDLPENPEAEGAPAPEYHLDLTWSLGLRYAWLGELTRIPGQARPLGVRDWLAPGSPAPREVLAHAARALSRRAAYRETLARHPHPDVLRNRLLAPRTMRDGRVVQSFMRCGDFARATLADLPWLLRPTFLDALERSGGISILFLHWAKHPGRRFESLDPVWLAALRALAERVQGGRLWVTTTGRLLAYAEARDALRVEQGADGRVALRADPLPDGRRLAVEDLAGLALRTMAPGAPPEFLFEGRPLAVEPVPGAPGVVRVPLVPLRFPEPPGGAA